MPFTPTKVARRNHHDTLRWRLGWCLALLLGAAMAIAASPLEPTVAPIDQRLRISPTQLALLEDKSGRLSIEEAQSAWSEGRFQQGADDTNLGVTSSAYWARLELRNPGDRARTIILTHDYAPTDSVQLFVINPGVAPDQHFAGDSWPVSEGNRRVPSFELDLPATSTTPVYLRVETESNLNFALSLWPPDRAERYERVLSLCYGVLFGAILACVMSLLFTWLMVREPVALMLGAYLLSFGAYLAFLQGFPSDWMLPAAAGSINALHMASLGLLFGTGALFYRQFLELSENIRWADRAVACLQWAGFSVVLSPLLPPPLLALILLLVAGIGPIFTMCLAFYLWTKRQSRAGVFAIGWTIAHLSSLLGTLRVQGWLPNSEFLLHLPAIGCAVAMGIFTGALGLRFARERAYAFEDELTGLANRRRFEAQAGIEFGRACRYGRPLSLIVFDVDNFKLVNDSHGHAFGDRVLQTLGRRTEQHFRSADLVARLGGDEFAVLLVETPLSVATDIAERLRATQESTLEEGQRVTISIGASEILPEDTILEELMGRADEAMYQAKHRGGNQIAWLPEVEEIPSAVAAS